ncbi:MAG TPA: hypothetical protein VMW15_07235 [Terracidiphilus sp.]|nr:hypothetical protein [Terracidiphilus sp.]
MIEMKTTVISMSVHRADMNPRFGEGVTHVSLQDDAGGPFIELRQCDDRSEMGMIKLDMEELEAVTAAARRLMAGWPGEE